MSWLICAAAVLVALCVLIRILNARCDTCHIWERHGCAKCPVCGHVYGPQEPRP